MTKGIKTTSCSQRAQILTLRVKSRSLAVTIVYKDIYSVLAEWRDVYVLNLFVDSFFCLCASRRPDPDSFIRFPRVWILCETAEVTWILSSHGVLENQPPSVSVHISLSLAILPLFSHFVTHQGKENWENLELLFRKTEWTAVKVDDTSKIYSIYSEPVCTANIF